MTTINNFQKLCIDAIEKIDKKFKIKRDSQLGLSQLMEEIGELAEEINKPKLRHQKINPENLNGEFADVLLQLAILAKLHNINFEKAVKSKIKELKERHYF